MGRIQRPLTPGAPAKLTIEHKAFLARIVEEGPIPATWGGAVAGLRLDHATARRVRAVGVGRQYPSGEAGAVANLVGVSGHRASEGISQAARSMG